MLHGLNLVLEFCSLLLFDVNLNLNFGVVLHGIHLKFLLLLHNTQCCRFPVPCSPLREIRNALGLRCCPSLLSDLFMANACKLYGPFGVLGTGNDLNAATPSLVAFSSAANVATLTSWSLSARTQLEIVAAFDS